jgi:hypothetical protein
MYTQTMHAENRTASGHIDLIASDRVEGTTVYDTTGDRLGSIARVMITKTGGQVEYAVLSSGGLFGLGTRYYPLPWNLLDYDTERGGYVVSLDKKLIENAPSYDDEGKEPEYNADYRERVYSHYGMPY